VLFTCCPNVEDISMRRVRIDERWQDLYPDIVAAGATDMALAMEGET